MLVYGLLELGRTGPVRLELALVAAACRLRWLGGEGVAAAPRRAAKRAAAGRRWCRCLWVESGGGGIGKAGGVGFWITELLAVVVAELALVNVVSRRIVIIGGCLALTGAAVVAILVRFNAVRSVDAVGRWPGSGRDAEALVAGRGLHAVRGARGLAHLIGVVADHVATARERRENY